MEVSKIMGVSKMLRGLEEKKINTKRQKQSKHLMD